jgi:hypothetical protein
MKPSGLRLIGTAAWLVMGLLACSLSFQAAAQTWRELNQTEQAALKPLASQWNSLPDQQKQKWRTIARNYHQLPPAEQGKLHERMASWSTLTPQDRAQARRNFAVNKEITDGLTPEQRRVQWEAYQQLSPDERRQLAERAKAGTAVPPSGAAMSARPKDPLKFQPTPEFGTAKALARGEANKAAPKPGAKISVADAVQPDGRLNPSAPAGPPVKR